MANVKPMKLDKHMASALDDQRVLLWEAGSIVESVGLALQAQFGRDWPADVPNFKMALDIAGRMINVATGNMEAYNIEELAKKIAAEQREITHE